jgi:hypothetical protein
MNIRLTTPITKIEDAIFIQVFSYTVNNKNEVKCFYNENVG